MTTTKAKRIKFSDEEKFLILEEFALRKEILIPKSGRYKNTADRQQAWEEITRAINSLNPLVQRTPEEIRKKWKNMVVDARKELTTERHPVLRKQPRDRLYRNIFALLNQTDGTLPKPLHCITETSEAPVSECRIEATSRSPCIPYLHRDSPAPQSCTSKARPEVGDADTAASQMDPLKHHLGLSLQVTQSGEGPECKRKEAPENEERIPREPCVDAPWSHVRADEPHHAQLCRTTLPPTRDSRGPGVGRILGPPKCSSDVASACKTECSLSPILEWPYLGSACSPLSQSSGLGSPGSDGVCSTMDDHVSPPGAEDAQTTRRGCSSPTRRPSREFWEKQSRLQTEVLELQKETLQLQKEKILLEKEKLFLEILKLRRELGT